MAILCGTDLSEASAGALAVACALAARRGEPEVVAVHVVDDAAAAERERGNVASQIAAIAKTATVRVRSELVIGAPEDALVATAASEAATLIVIAASSRGGAQTRLGSTAHKLIESARVPVLVLRDPAPWLAYARGERPLKLLLGVDDSVACDLGIQWMHAMRRGGGVEVVLGAIYYPDESAEHYGLHARALVDRDPEIEALIARDMVRKFGAGEGVTARARRGLGRIGDHLIELARETEVDAIVIGTAQRTGLGRLGSVSGVIVNDAPQSVVCVPPNAEIPTLAVPPIASALVATDLSGFANRAVPFAFAITPEAGEVHLVHVVEPGAVIDEAEIKRALLALAPSGMARRLAAHIVRGDDAATAIGQAAARLGCDAICIASHGRSGISRALVGSVADKLLRATRKPVLVLRPA